MFAPAGAGKRLRHLRFIICANISVAIRNMYLDNIIFLQFALITQEKDRCLAELFRSAMELFAHVRLRECRRRFARGGFPANINLSVH